MVHVVAVREDNTNSFDYNMMFEAYVLRACVPARSMVCTVQVQYMCV